jgi:hypothetical protein
VRDKIDFEGDDNDVTMISPLDVNIGTIAGTSRDLNLRLVGNGVLAIH